MIQAADYHMVELVLDETRRFVERPILERADHEQITCHRADLFPEPPDSRVDDLLAGTRVAATGVAPTAGEVML